MGKLFDAIKKNYDELAQFQEKQEQNFMVETTYDNIVNNIPKLSYLNFFINQVENDKKYYFNSEEKYDRFIEENKEIFSNNSKSIPKAKYDGNTVMIDVKGVDYEKILNTLEEKIGKSKTEELLEKFKNFTPREPQVVHPFKDYTKGIVNNLDELNLSEEKIAEFKEVLEYASEELINKKQDEDETDHIIDQINSVRERIAKSSIKKVAEEIGADSEKVDSLKDNIWSSVTFKTTETEDKMALNSFLSVKPEYSEEYKKKVIELDKLITEKGLIPNGFAGESGSKEYGFLDYFAKADELKDALLKYGKLVDNNEKIEALENITLKANELKDITNKYNDVLDFIKENFDTSKISLNGNVYSGRVKSSDIGLEGFAQNLPQRWDLKNAAPGVVLSGFAQLKGVAKVAGVSIEEYMENPTKYYMLGAKKISLEEDKKHLIPIHDENGNQIPLGKRIAHIIIQDDKAYTNLFTAYNLQSRGLEFLNYTSEVDENTNKNIVISGAVVSLATSMYNHSSEKLFTKEYVADYESIQNLFALGNDADNLFALSKNYLQDDATVANVDDSYNLKIKVMNKVNPANETRRVMGVIRDYLLERKQMYIDRRNDDSTDIELEESISPAQMLVAGKLYLNDFIYKNNINLLSLDKKQRDEVMSFLNDPVRAFVNKYDGEENLLRTNSQGKMLETYGQIDDEFKRDFGRLYKATGDNFVKAFDDLNTQMKGRNTGKSIAEIIEANKGGYFEKKFDSSSKEYKALIASVEAATDPESITYGDLSGAKVYAQKYVDHKLPQGANFNKLSENEKRRVEFCHTIIGATLQMELNQKMVDSNMKIAPDNEQFQQKLKTDVDSGIEIENNIEVSNEIVNENNIIAHNE